MKHQPRVPAGHRTGGQFLPHRRSDADVQLQAEHDECDEHADDADLIAASRAFRDELGRFVHHWSHFVRAEVASHSEAADEHLEGLSR